MLSQSVLFNYTYIWVNKILILATVFAVVTKDFVLLAKPRLIREVI